MNKKIYWSLLVPIAISPIAIVASCSSNDASQKSDIELATNRITESLKNYPFTMREFQKPSQIKADEIETEMMQPSLNFGFETKLEKIGNGDDKTGELTLKVKMTRAADENKEFEIKLNGFLTEAQEAANQEIKPEEYFNEVGPMRTNITLVTNQGNTELIPNEITKELLLNKYIDSKNTGTSQNMLFKQKLPDDIKLEVLNIKQAFFYGIEEPIIQAQVQLVKNGKTTSPYLLSVAGFTAHALYLNKNVDYAIQMFDTLGKLMIDPDKPNQNDSYYINKKPSEIKNVEEIKKYLRNYSNSSGQPKIFEINKIVENSFNDKEGSIVVEFKFINIINPNITENKEIKLYGFKPVND